MAIPIISPVLLALDLTLSPPSPWVSGVSAISTYGLVIVVAEELATIVGLGVGLIPGMGSVEDVGVGVAGVAGCPREIDLDASLRLATRL